MRRFLFAFLLGLSIIGGRAVLAEAQPPEQASLFTKADLRGEGHPYPGLEKVHEVFREHYSIEKLEGMNAYLRFDKNPYGWSVSVIEHPWEEEKVEVHRALFWSAERGQFRNLWLKGIRSGRTSQNHLEERSLYTDGFSRWCYRMLPYYKYPGWELDLINRLAEAHPLSDTLAYALGRAYSSRASDILGDTLPVPLFDEHVGFPEEEPVLEREPMERYYEHAHRAVELYDTVKARDPDFGSYVGSITICRDHLVMENFLELYYGRSLQEAKKELTDSLYSPLTRSIAKNLLRSCDSNALLLTEADNNFLPLLYMQYQHGVRTDVKVISRAYLDVPAYVKTFWGRTLSSGALTFDIDQEHIPYLFDHSVKGKAVKDTVEARDELMDLETWIDRLNREIAQGKKGERVEGSFRNAFKVYRGDDTLIARDTGSFLSIEDLMVLDLLADHQRKECPIYCGPTFTNRKLFHLRGRMYPVGNLLQIGPREEEMGRTDILDRDHELFTQKFQWKGMERVNRREKRWLFRNQVYAFMPVVKGFLKEGEEERAKEIVELLDDRVLLDSSLFALYKNDGILHFMPYLIHYAYELEMEERGDRLALQTLYGTRRQKSIVPKSRRNDILKKLWSVLDNYDRDEVLSQFRRSEEY